MKSKHELQSSFKGSGTAFMMWFFFGAHYAYLGKWGIQFLYWCTLGGLGFWAFIDLFRMGGMVRDYNAKISFQIEEIEEKTHQRHLETMAAMKQ